MGFASKRKTGFSLVELVIVIVIIGVIAAIAIPRVTQATKGAGESALSSDLAVLRNAIEMYASEHQGVYPGKNDLNGGAGTGTATDFVAQLTQYTGGAGATSATRDATHQFGPYLRKGIPPLPVGTNKGQEGVLFDAANSPPVALPAQAKGWVYNPDTGDIVANSTDNNDAGTKTFDKY
jgi:general secretion pathway protein G